jgi:hypothetical protein
MAKHAMLRLTSFDKFTILSKYLIFIIQKYQYTLPCLNICYNQTRVNGNAKTLIVIVELELPACRPRQYETYSSALWDFIILSALIFLIMRLIFWYHSITNIMELLIK